MFGTTFFVLTGLHGAHVTIGIIWLLLAVGPLDAGPAAAPSNSEAVEIAGLYWHFVDIVWIFIFTAIYLIPAALRHAHDRRHVTDTTEAGHRRRASADESATRSRSSPTEQSRRGRRRRTAAPRRRASTC